MFCHVIKSEGWSPPVVSPKLLDVFFESQENRRKHERATNGLISHKWGPTMPNK